MENMVSVCCANLPVPSAVYNDELHDLQDPEKFKSRMHSLAYGNVMAAAARDYQKV